uniref:3'-phosphate/5'-hydroxy nucleic acid ligase n=1 Tax=Romanomermis culicivorax TaxID=13658 RepID=A0A915JPG1_ROMCU
CVSADFSELRNYASILKKRPQALQVDYTRSSFLLFKHDNSLAQSHKSSGTRRAIGREKGQMTPGVELLAVPFGHTPSSGVGQQIVQKEATRYTSHGAGRPTRRARRLTCEKLCNNFSTSEMQNKQTYSKKRTVAGEKSFTTLAYHLMLSLSESVKGHLYLPFSAERNGTERNAIDTTLPNEKEIHVNKERKERDKEKEKLNKKQ